MGSASKTFALFLTLILAMSCLTLLAVKPASAQTATPSSIPTPSVPEFTVQPVGPPTIVNTTYSLDPSTGEIVAHIGYTNTYSYVELTINNQPFNPSYGSMFFNVQLKNQNTNNEWIDIYSAQNRNYPGQTANSDYTNVLIGIEGQFFSALAGTQTDIQVQALLGYYYIEATGPPGGVLYAFNGTESGWSTSQTVSIPANVPLSPTPAPSSSSSTPTSPTSTSVSSSSYASLLLITTVAFVIIAFLLAVIIALLLLMRHQKTANLSK